MSISCLYLQEADISETCLTNCPRKTAEIPFPSANELLTGEDLVVSNALQEHLIKARGSKVQSLN